MPNTKTTSGTLFKPELVTEMFSKVKGHSSLENYAEINPEAAWAGKIIKRLRNIKSKEDET